ncbi:putative protein of unknown function (DUF4586) [Monocercomonoides exilis]|uniref:putative protein of unknown function (DUF4586) n=1 Tax=Monocercomonoides exilis TaxID=2049356 RepID=UPI0035597AEE|nr:putative protein of unknown function (DUF4586) [Monocercomonoides exilis]|eukprot:MONOS_8343.1-p1 / transcript=MONOS_8343.1 / gene=MONOS_8343 / organism=Monocercomonoides_exilis_PA203 / gene_product=unspecified product / transcript_product=unspecified product / location=Mono_scaffold00313:7419-8884(-) / protein_length=320 / sequence_SO=supercontig / SO=protein_coding / is_pseudo=false
MSSQTLSSTKGSTSGSKHIDLYELSPYLSSGDPYISDKDSILKDSRFFGKQLLTSPPKRGVTNDTTFTPFESLAVGEPYEQNPAQRKKDASAPPVSNKPFLPSSPGKLLTGPGDTHGLFTPFTYSGMSLDDSNESQNKKRKTKRSQTPGPSQISKRNFYTNPGKRGGSGYFHTTIGGYEYEYMSEPYGGDRAKVEKMKPKPPPVPFRSMSPPSRPLDTTVYAPLPIDSTKERKRMSKTMGDRPSTRSTFNPGIPFRPSSPGKKGITGTINPFPEYIPGADLKPSPTRNKTSTHQKVFLPSGNTSPINPASISLAKTSHHA